MSRSNPQWTPFQPPSPPHLMKYGGGAVGGSGSGGLFTASFQPTPSSPVATSAAAAAAHHYYRAPSNSSTGGSSSYHLMSQSSASSTASDFDIGVFSVGTFGGSGKMSSSMAEFSTTSNGFGGGGNGVLTASSQHQVIGASGNIRETGIIEKMLPTFGFIQCCDRQARLFFHFSQFDGTIEHLRVGDPVEFEMTYDRRNGKPIASNVSKISPETPQLLSEERVTGAVTSELRLAPHALHGRISYENRGECFFLPFGASDVEGNVSIKVGDLVSFQMASDPRNGNLVAHNVRLENPANPIHYRGVVCSLQPDESRGFIERADVVREIFFLYSDVRDEQRGVTLGDEVEFTIQTVQGKEVATNIVHLDPGTVVFEDVDPTPVKGQVQKALDPPTTGDGANKEPMSGRIRYRRDKDVVDVPFGERDMKGSFTLRHGDWVQFSVATDRRDKMRRATNISLLEDSFKVSDERREQGVLLSVKEHLYGFIRCVERDQNLFFHLSEVIDPERGLQIRDELEFTVAPDLKQTGRLTAVRVRRLPAGTVRFEETLHAATGGVVTREPTSSEPGLISCTGAELTAAGVTSLQFGHGAVADMRRCPRVGDSVQFSVLQSRRTRQLTVGQVTLVKRADPPPPSPQPAGAASSSPKSFTAGQQSSSSSSSNGKESASNGVLLQGYVAALKDGFGFIETLQHDREIFFHFSQVRGDSGSGGEAPVDRLQLGSEVQYTMGRTGSRVAAENVLQLEDGTLPAPQLLDRVLDGIVLRPMRNVDPDQSEYSGLIQANTTDEVAPAYQFGITSLVNKKEYLQMGDLVTFQTDELGQRAYNITIHRERVQSVVDSVKGQYGFLNYEHDEGKKLFFHVSEVQEGVTLREGDQVEFCVVQSHRTGRRSASQIVRLSAAAPSAAAASDEAAAGGKKAAGRSNSFQSQSERPSRVIQRIRHMALQGAGRPQQVLVLRQPRGPEDGCRGFSAGQRQPPSAVA